MLKIRMKRAGGKNRPFFRVVVVDSRKARDGRAVEELGYYNPLEEPMVVNVNRERVEYWTARGAQVSDSVRTLLKRENATHPSRRMPEAFEPAPPPEKPAAKPKKGKPAKAEKGEGGVAVAEEEAPASGGEDDGKKGAHPKAAKANAKAEPAAGEPGSAEAGPSAEKPSEG